ncbi:hypothetical protein KFE98_01160 [bacterium SCSIO 12741]|nr:hypothetical protein KFE98_01160 [bacterium SCSIO 12741]
MNWLPLPFIPLILACILALIHFRRQNRVWKWFSTYLFFSLVVQITASILTRFAINNLVLSHLLTWITPLWLAGFYYQLFRMYIPGAFLWVPAGVVGLLSIYNSIFIQDIFTFNSYSLTLLSVFLLILSLSTFIVLLEKDINAETAGLNWVNSGLFLYHASNLVFFYFGDYLMNAWMTLSLFRQAWLPHTFFSFTMYSLFVVGLWRSSRRLN